MLSILFFILALAILILAHEFGHFIVAKKAGIKVEEFGIGFPPRIFGLRRGETIYSINALPFGGFVKIFGEDAGEEIKGPDHKRSFAAKPKWVQALVLMAGVSANLLVAWVIISIGFVSGFEVPVSYSSFREVLNPRLLIVNVAPHTPAAEALLQPGDQILFLEDGNSSLQDLNAENVSQFISKTSGTLRLLYKRGEKTQAVELNPKEGIVAGKKAIGISMDMIGILKLPPHLAILEGARVTGKLFYATGIGIIGFFSNLFMGRSDFSQIAGPVGIAGMAKSAGELGWMSFLSFIAFISINLAVLNIFPFPALDGGRLLFVIIEAIKRSPLKTKTVTIANTLGFALLILLMLIVTFHDIVRLI